MPPARGWINIPDRYCLPSPLAGEGSGMRGILYMQQNWPRVACYTLTLALSHGEREQSG